MGGITQPNPSLGVTLTSNILLSARLLLLLLGLIRPERMAAADPAWRPEVLSRLDEVISAAIAARKCPGAVLWLEHRGEVYRKPFGQRALQPAPEPMTVDTIFDVSSLTKAIATAPAVMRLLERGDLRLEDRVQQHLPEFRGPGTAAVTVRHLLTHTSGLLVGISGAEFTNHAGALAAAFRERPRPTPGTEFHYCDLNFILLGEIVQRVARQPLDEFLTREIFGPLQMNDTRYRPPAEALGRIAPTQALPAGLLRGVVHDSTSRRMGGVSGHAGVFATASDLAKFARMMLGQGEADGVRLLKPETVRLMTSVQSPPGVQARRGLGWDIDSGFSRPRGLLFPLGSYGHTGFSGALLWIDPFSKTFVILLTNRLHPDGQGNVMELYAAVGTLAARAVGDFDFRHVPQALPFRTNFIPWGTVTNLLGPVRP